MIEIDEIDVAEVTLGTAIFSAMSLTLLLATICIWFVITVGMSNVFLPMSNLPTAAKIGISALSVFVNLLFSSGLVYLYLRQANTQERQASIQERQQKIMEADYIPSVIITVDKVLEDCIQMKCTNQGTGLAKNFRVSIDFFVSENSMDGPGEIHEGVELERLSEVIYTHYEEVPNYGTRERTANYQGGVTAPRQTKTADSFATVRSQEIIRGGDSERLEFSIYFERFLDLDPSPSQLSFQKGIESLQKEGVETLGYRMKLSYDDVFNEKVEDVNLASGWVDIRTGVSLPEFIKANENTGITKQPSPFSSETALRTVHLYYI